MTALFGVSMTVIMYVLLAFLALALLSVGFVCWRNRVMFKLGVRNIPRRRAQTTLIVLGLMLSTVIISAAFTTGDTVQRSVTGEIYGLLGSVDEAVYVRNVGDTQDTTLDDSDLGAIQPQTFSQQNAAPLIAAMHEIPDVDAVVPSYSSVAVAVNLDKRQSSPLFSITGLDPDSMGSLPDIEDKGGGRLRLQDLGPDEIYIDESAADDLEVKAGDSIMLYTLGQQQAFKVRAIAKDRRLAGAMGLANRREGGVLPLSVAQSLFKAPGQLTVIAVSNKGDARGGLAHSKDVSNRIQQLLDAQKPSVGAAAAGPNGGQQLALTSIKRTGVDAAEAGASILTTFFLVLGLFSIGAGVLLIFMIFVMLAAERKPEMGMARAVGIKRADLVQTFLAEGMGYNMIAAMVGTGLGVVVSFAMSRAMATIFSRLGLSISPYVTLRSLAVSYSLGVVLTFLTVTFSSWRVSQINIVRAIRDIPEPPTPRPLWRAHGFFATLRGLLFRPTSRAGWIRRGVGLLAVLLLMAGSAGVLPLVALGALLFAGVLASFAWTQRTLPALLRAGVFIGSLLVLPLSLAAAVFMTFQLGPLLLIGGVLDLAVFVATSSHSAFLLLFGLSLTPLGLALVVRSFGANERVTYTACGLFLVYIWEFDFSVGLIKRIFGKTDGNIEMFFLSGVMVTVAATFLVVYNADFILGPLTRVGRGLGALLPSIKMAVAYPLANRMRTGLTMAMFCLVIFALTVISSMNYNFNRLFISDRALGGWDVYVDENPTNPIGDLRQRLAQANSPAEARVQAVGVSSIISDRNAAVCQTGVGDSCDPRASDTGRVGFVHYQVRGEDDGFLSNARVPLQTRARGYTTDEDVWHAVQSDPTLAVVDANALPGGGFGGSGFLTDIDAAARQFDPVSVTLIDQRTRKASTVKVIGIIELGSSSTYQGLHLRQSAVDALFSKPDLRRFFVKTTPGTDNRQVSRDIESALLTTGAQSDSLRHAVDKASATFNGFFYLMQGFMGLGLLVGVAAVGVIAFRTVVERRQQIGMLRAIGYTQGMIGLTFLIESSFISFMGVLSGVVFALILARQLIVQAFANQGVTTFAVPWLQVGAIAAVAFGFALLMTLIPSRQAASIPIAQALRYE